MINTKKLKPATGYLQKNHLKSSQAFSLLSQVIACLKYRNIIFLWIYISVEIKFLSIISISLLKKLKRSDSKMKVLLHIYCSQ